MPTTHAPILVRLLLLVCALATASPIAAAAAPPRLVVVIVVDQMRGDYLSRWEDQLDGGLKRLWVEGAVFDQAHHAHARTKTAPGHAVLATGTHPSSNGIVGNMWWDRDRWTAVRAVAGNAANLRRTTLGDWLKRSSPASRVYALSAKDRAAILLGGQGPDGAYWYDAPKGRFVTSLSYHPTPPAWLEAYNASGRPDAWRSARWTPLRACPPSLCREDAFEFENDGVDTTFPHALGDDRQYPARLLQTPFGDRALLDLTWRMVVDRRLGTSDATDLLWLSLSSADWIGHLYGPDSVEVFDYYQRLDRWLDAFLRLLTRQAGDSGLLVVLSSDHGVAPIPEAGNRRGKQAWRVENRRVAGAVRKVAGAVFDAMGLAEPPRIQWSEGVYLGAPKQSESAKRLPEIRRRLADALVSLPWVEAAYTLDELTATDRSDDPHLEAFRRSTDPQRSPDISLRLGEGSIGHGPYPGHGTNHGSSYSYDTSVPLIFFGDGIAAAHIDTPVSTVDLAPTLAEWIGIDAPQDLDGRSRADLIRGGHRPRSTTAPDRSE